MLAWLARAVGDVRYQLASIGYLGAALIHAVFFDAPLDQLYSASARPTSGAVAFVGTAVAAASPRGTAGRGPKQLRPAASSPRSSRCSPPSARPGELALVAAGRARFRPVRRLARPARTRPVDRFRAVEEAFEWGHVAVTGLWGSRGRRSRRRAPAQAGRAPDARASSGSRPSWSRPSTSRRKSSDGGPRGYAYSSRGGLARRRVARSAERRDDVEPALRAAGSRWRASASASRPPQLVGGHTAETSRCCPLAALYGVIGALVLATRPGPQHFLWAPALVVAGYAASGSSWTETGSFSPGPAQRQGSPCSVGSSTRSGCWSRPSRTSSSSSDETLSSKAPPGDFFEASRHPESGVPSVLLAIGGDRSVRAPSGRRAGRADLPSNAVRRDRQRAREPPAALAAGRPRRPRPLCVVCDLADDPRHCRDRRRGERDDQLRARPLRGQCLLGPARAARALRGAERAD